MATGAFCAGMAITVPALARRGTAHLVDTVPAAYTTAAARAQVPARLLYGIALQESAMLWGEKVLPWLWTLNVQGTPHRYATYKDSVRALNHVVHVRGVRNVDCGPMQVNWRWHSDQLGSVSAAMDARHNLAVGASILARHFRETKDWFIATGRYHNEADRSRAQQYARSVYERLPRLKVAV
jgi:hypothetical protein